MRGSVAAALAVVAVLFELTHDGFRIDALTAVVVGQSSLDGLFGQNRAVHLDGRQTFQSFHNGLVGQLESLVDGLALDEVGGHAAGCDGMFVFSFNRTHETVRVPVEGEVVVSSFADVDGETASIKPNGVIVTKQ